MRPDKAGLPDPERATQIDPTHLDPGKLGLIVFGPGHGEAIVLVFPDGTVGTIDGCREPDRDRGQQVRPTAPLPHHRTYGSVSGGSVG